MAKEKWGVIGSGFNAIVASRILISKGYDVTIIDKAKQVGGVLQSIEKDGFYLDKGCHLFANRDKWSMEFFDDMYPNGLVPVAAPYASVFEKNLTEGISIPDFTNLSVNVQKEILFDVINNIDFKSKPASNLHQVIVNRYGITAANYYHNFIEKAYCINSLEVSPETLNDLTFSIRRIKATIHEVGSELKKVPFLDELLAISSLEDPFRFFKDDVENFTSLNYYPKEKGLYGFCESAQNVLAKRGVKFQLGTSIKEIKLIKENAKVVLENDELQFDKLYWAAPLESIDSFFEGINFGAQIHQVPMVLVYFYVPTKAINSDLAYIHHFDLDCPVFRYAIPYNYGNTEVNGQTYIMCELPLRMNSEYWNDESRCVNEAWAEVKRLGLVNVDIYNHYQFFKLPVSYRIPKTQYADVIEDAKNKINPSVVFGLNKLSLSKNAIVNFVRKELENV